MTVQLFLSNSALSYYSMCSRISFPFVLCFPPSISLLLFSSIFHLLHSLNFEDPVEIGVKYVNKSEKTSNMKHALPIHPTLFLVEAMALDVNVPWIIF